MGRTSSMDGKAIMIINETEIMFFNVHYVEHTWLRTRRTNLNKHVEHNIIGYLLMMLVDIKYI